MHKERMQTLFAFEQLIINTECGDETQDQVSEENAEEDQYFKDQIAQLYNPLYHGL
jgi:hypothetical protein